MFTFAKQVFVQVAIQSGFAAVDQAVRTVVAQRIKNKLDTRTRVDSNHQH